MASLSDLAQTIAAAEGLDRGAVNLIARYVREAGLITTRGRGPSAARMGVTDAANLLIAVNATPTASEAARTVRAYRELGAFEPRVGADRRPAFRYGTLGEGIEQLIHATGVGELPDVFLTKGVPFDLQEAFSKGAVHIDVRFRISNLTAFVKIAELPEPDVLAPALAEAWLGGGIISTHLFFAFGPPKVRGPLSKRKPRTGDRLEEIAIGFRTLSAVGKLLQH